MVGRRPAQWDFPQPKQLEKLLAQHDREDAQEAVAVPSPTDSDDGWWQSVLNDPRAAGRPWLPIEQRRLSEVPRDTLRVECLRCFRTVEISKVDAIRLWGPHQVLKDCAQPLLEPGCKVRSGSNDDGCWPSWVK